MQVEAQEVVTENFTTDKLRSYLLGLLPEDLQQQIEERLLTDASLMEELHAAEEDLADDYIVGVLEGLEREAFETVFLAHPVRRRKLSFANALHRYATASRQQPSRRRLFSFLYKQAPIFQVALATAFLMVIILGGWVVMQTTRFQRELDNIAAQQQNRIEDLRRERTERQRLEQELADLKAGAQNPDAADRQPSLRLFAAALAPGLVRDAAGPQRIAIPADKDAVRLDLLLDNAAYPAYDAVLETEEGTQLLSMKGLQPSTTPAGSAIAILLSKEILKPRDYALKLAGGRAPAAPESAATYHFRVTSN